MTDTRIDTDIVVAGGGLAGLAMTARLAVAGYTTLCVDAGDRPGVETARNDRRTTAILMSGIETLRKTGAWDVMAAEAQSMMGLRILDCGGRTADIREDVLFEAAEIGDGPFGWNVENGKGRLALADRIDALSRAELINGAKVIRSMVRRDAVFVSLSNGVSVRAKLLIGADGRNSFVRKMAGINHREHVFAQKIIACRVQHSETHHGISTEMHHVGGPLTFAPLPGNMSGVVWMSANRDADRLISLDDEGFRSELMTASQGVAGEITHAGNRAVWPSSICVAHALTAPRVALVAEAAHAFPPIGAQGFNTSLRDVETLASLAEQTDDPGAPDLLRQYARKRMPDIIARTVGVDLLNRSVLSSVRLVRDLRRAGLGVLGRTAPAKRFAMRVGMGG